MLKNSNMQDSKLKEMQELIKELDELITKQNKLSHQVKISNYVMPNVLNLLISLLLTLNIVSVYRVTGNIDPYVVIPMIATVIFAYSNGVFYQRGKNLYQSTEENKWQSEVLRVMIHDNIVSIQNKNKAKEAI
jgi:hypothetical protein